MGYGSGGKKAEKEVLAVHGVTALLHGGSRVLETLLDRPGDQTSTEHSSALSGAAIGMNIFPWADLHRIDASVPAT